MGKYKIRLITDLNNVVTESNGTNNTVYFFITVRKQ